MSVTEFGGRPKGYWGPVARVGGPIVLGLLCLGYVANTLSQDAISGLGHALRDLAGWQWGAAGLATLVSFWAVGRYDAVLHCHLRTGCAPRDAALSGAAAIAVGQTVGMGVLSGALVRWRLIPTLSLPQAMGIAFGVAVTFFIGLALCLGLAGLILGNAVLTPLVCALLILLFAVASLSPVFFPKFAAFGMRIRLPGPFAMIKIAALTALDTTAAGLALWAVMPLDAGIGFDLLLPAYLLALGAALLSGTPGGVGPFELTLFAMMPGGMDADLLCGLVAFRAVYYAVPALFAAAILMRPFPERPPRTVQRRAVAETDLRRMARAEFGLSRAAGTEILANRTARLACVQPGHTLCALFGQLRGRPDQALQMLSQAARQDARIPLIYKADAGLAVKARRLGWRALHVADDLVVDTHGFRTEGRTFRQLRRKLRRAETAGVQISESHTHPWGALREIDAEWQQRHGAARGITMGQYCPIYLSHQAIFVARLDGRVIAYASFHLGADDLCLDLMRMRGDVPDGTMQALIVHAINTARTTGRTQVSLAALPPCDGPVARLAARCIDPGLGQFKLAFAPRRVPRYAIAKSWVGMGLALLDLWLAMQRNTNPAHKEHEDYEFAYKRAM